MRIGPIGSNPFADLYRMSISRVNEINQNRDGQAAKNVIGEDNKNLNYLERQAKNAQRQDLSLEQSTFDVSL